MLLILPFHTIIYCLAIVFRDRKRKRFVRDTGKEDQKKKIRIDGGQVISNKKNKKNLYPSNKMSLCVLIYCYDCYSLPLLTIFSCVVDSLSDLNGMTVTRSGRKNTGWMTEGLAQMEKQEEEGGGLEEVEEKLQLQLQHFRTHKSQLIGCFES